MRVRALAAALLSSVTQSAAAAPDVVGVSAPEVVVLKAGGHAAAQVAVTVKPGFHVQANPVLNPFLIPIVLAVPGAAGIVTAKPAYPAPKRMRFKGTTEDLVIYDETFAIALPVSVARGSPAGETVLAGSLRYQACDDAHCLPPRTLPVRLSVRVTP